MVSSMTICNKPNIRMKVRVPIMPPHPCLLPPGEKEEFTFRRTEQLNNHPPPKLMNYFGEELAKGGAQVNCSANF
jgi:hypothetical protein